MVQNKSNKKPPDTAKLRLIAIDPSSTCTGFGVVDIPRNQRGVVEYWHHCVVKANPKSDYVVRAAKMAIEVRKLVRDNLLWSVLTDASVKNVCLIEVPSGKVHKPRPISGLSVYGFAVGAVWAHLRFNDYLFDLYRRGLFDIVPVTDTSWIGGFTKEKRRGMVENLFPQYTRKGDGGMDASDALAMAVIWARKEGLL